MNQKKTACITLDLENDWYFGDQKLDHLTLKYIDEYIEMIRTIDVPVSIFVVGKTIEKHPDKVAQLRESIDCEFHLHSYCHDLSKSYNFQSEVRRGINVFEDFFDTFPMGYRAPQGNIEPHELIVLDDLGFKFDSSVFPSYRPGVYNNLDTPLTPFRPEQSTNLIEFPFAAVPRLRIPIAQSYLQLIGRSFLELLKHTRMPEILVFDSHLQDFYHTASHEQLNQPLRFIHKRNLSQSTELFKRFINILRERGYSFGRLSSIYRSVRDEI
jgi:peptidoglycan/xylan/chitin deacetylase (PgdA/CDA1 family)